MHETIFRFRTIRFFFSVARSQFLAGQIYLKRVPSDEKNSVIKRKQLMKKNSKIESHS